MLYSIKESCITNGILGNNQRGRKPIKYAVLEQFVNSCRNIDKKV
jgi:hypothetical protein